jgi:hypothetical protein
MLAASSVLVALLSGNATAASQISITLPVSGESISRSATPSLTVGGLVSFEEPRQEERTLYMGRTGCGSGSDDAHLSTVPPGSDHRSGCQFVAQPANEPLILLGDPGLSVTYPSEAFSFTLDASRPITGTIVMSGGYGQATTEVTVRAETATGEQLLLGADSETYTVTGAPVNVLWSVQPPSTEDKKDFTSLILNVRVRGVNALHGAVDHRNGASNLVVGVWSPGHSQKVEFAIDSSNFVASAVRTATIGEDGSSWSGSALTPAPGNHILYARAVAGTVVTKATPVPFTVTP